MALTIPDLTTLAEDVPNSGQTLVIDPGHGGLDGGAVSAAGLKESEVNLAIARRLEFFSRFFGLPTVMTRTGEELDYPPDLDTVREKKRWDQDRRVGIVNAEESAVLISIHQNNYPDSRPYGSQVYYAGTDSSREFGELTHALLIEKLNPENRRVAMPIDGSIYLMRSVRCPAILVECGFLSNPDEAAALSEGTYQTKLAAVLLSAYLRFHS